MSWFSAKQLAELHLPGLPTTSRGVQHRAKREGWVFKRNENDRPLCRRIKRRGGGLEYHYSILPLDCTLALALAGATPPQDGVKLVQHEIQRRLDDILFLRCLQKEMEAMIK